MGCDIHIHIEHRFDADSPWQAHGKWAPLGAEESAERLEYFNPERYQRWYDEGRSPHPDVVAAAMAPGAPQLVEQPIRYHGRSYTLFAALAGVRNQDWRIVPIAEPRGMPDDGTTEVLAEWARWGPDAHSASHVTLKELTLWEGWRQTYDSECWVAEGRFPHQRLDDEKFSRLGEVANSLGRLPYLEPDAWNLSTCSWSSDARAWRVLKYRARLDLNVSEEWWRYLAEVHRIGVLYGADNVRTVFWFDN